MQARCILTRMYWRAPDLSFGERQLVCYNVVPEVRTALQYVIGIARKVRGARGDAVHVMIFFKAG